MNALAIPFEECRYYDYSMALKAFKEMGCKGKPKFGVLTFQGDKEELPTVGWCSEEKEDGEVVFQPLPIFKSFRDKKSYHTILFTETKADEVFETDGNLYITVQNGKGVDIRRIDMLFDETIVMAATLLKGIPPLDYILCEVKTIEAHPELVGYYWIGYGEQPLTGVPMIMFVPLFAKDSEILNNYSPLELDRVAVDIGSHIQRDNQIWQVTEHPENGVTVKHLFTMQSTTLN